MKSEFQHVIIYHADSPVQSTKKCQ